MLRGRPDTSFSKSVEYKKYETVVNDIVLRGINQFLKEVGKKTFPHSIYKKSQGRLFHREVRSCYAEAHKMHWSFLSEIINVLLGHLEQNRQSILQKKTAVDLGFQRLNETLDKCRDAVTDRIVDDVLPVEYVQFLRVMDEGIKKIREVQGVFVELKESGCARR